MTDRLLTLTPHDRYDFVPITDRPDFAWPEGRRLAVYVGLNIEWFSFMGTQGATLAGANPAPDVLNYGWRDYGNRVGLWRMLDLFDDLGWNVSALLNASICDAAPPILEAFLSRGDEIVSHGFANSQAPGQLSREDERRVLQHAFDRLGEAQGTPPRGYLAPLISQSEHTPDLLAEIGYAYNLDWAHDEQPVWMRTTGAPLLSVPYPQELNDVPQVMQRRIEAPAFADMIIRAFDLHLRECAARPVVMGIALHPYLMGQAHRFAELERALRHIAQRADDKVWFTTAGAIDAHYRELGL